MTFGPVSIGPIAFSLYWMLLGLSLAVLGRHGFYMSALARVFFDYSGRIMKRWLRLYSYTRSVVLGALAMVAGAALAVPLVTQCLRSGLICGCLGISHPPAIWQSLVFFCDERGDELHLYAGASRRCSKCQTQIDQWRVRACARTRLRARLPSRLWWIDLAYGCPLAKFVDTQREFSSRKRRSHKLERHHCTPG